MIDGFKSAAKTLRSSNSRLVVVPVNGCGYGRDAKPDKGHYHKYCGQKFWEFISGSDSLYKDIVEPLGHKAKERNDEFLQSYSQVVNKLTIEFSTKFCKADGSINWEKILELNSAIESPPRHRKR